MKKGVLAFSIISFCAMIACSKSGTTSSSSVSEDTSASGAVAGSVGQALGGSSGSGSVAFNENLFLRLIWEQAHASNTCPTVKTANGAGCTQNGNAADLVYAACSFGNSAATWTGTHELTLSNGTAVICGTFPNTATLPMGQSIQRQWVTGTLPGTGARTSAYGTVITVDHATANLGNFDNHAISHNIGAGFGTQVVFDGTGKRTQVVVNQRIHSTKFDHSISGSLNLTESPAGTRTITTGTITVYHNLLKVVGTSQFTNVVYNDTCTTPVSGTITTTFNAGTNVSPTALGALVVGKSETLTFNSCGSQTLTDVSGSTSSVAVSGI